MQIDIHTLWGLRKGFGGDSPEMMTAWDEFSIEGNPEGWDDARAQAIESWGDELEAHRVVIVTIDHDQVAAAFEEPKIAGSVRMDAQP